MNMAVLNYKNRPLFNEMIENSRFAFAKSLPNTVQIDTGEGKESFPVDDKMRSSYVDTYVDELDDFGTNLYGKPLKDIFATCVKEKEVQLLEQAETLSSDVKAIYNCIWNRAYAKTMDAVKEDIMYDAEKHFEEEMYDRVREDREQEEEYGR
jgi:hypothetical protein